jgi:hypothetical protein
MSELEGGLPRAGEIAPGAADAIGQRPAQPMPDAPETLVELAIESVLEQVPEVAAEGPEAGGKYQPWADTAAPPAKNKRPLDELLESYRARVAEAPDARAGRPQAKHPAAAFFDRFGPPRRSGQGEAKPSPDARRGRSRRRRQRRGRRGGRGEGGSQTG